MYFLSLEAALISDAFSFLFKIPLISGLNLNGKIK